ncbi:hypothetical protein A2880_02925 [Candidatus Peribacteria bacterium RIFCSPHIGHO2_01_FULL_49_38]|nr:MAG: hypothetical protein A2880_02925 [Candidatus Peribacteria bacterium RIFCSPHIGHO2_01_FULL_49_38]
MMNSERAQRENGFLYSILKISMPRKTLCRPRPLLSFLVIASVFLSVIGILSSLQFGVHANTSDVRYIVDNEEEHYSPLPLSFPSNGQNIEALFTLTHTTGAPTVFRITPDDCLEELVINAVPFVHEDIPFCDWTHGRIFDLTETLLDGANSVSARVKDHGNIGGLQFLPVTPWWYDAITLLRRVILFVIGTYALVMLLRALPFTKHMSTPLRIVLITGILLRVFYVSATPHTVRGYDTDGHIAYIEHMRSEMSIPNPQDGWEFYQPPLYYALGAAWESVAASLPFLLPFSHPQQTLSLFLAMIAFCLVPRIAQYAFPQRKDAVSRLFLTATFAVFPGIVFSAARINNDILSLLLGTIALLLLLHFWKTRTLSLWMILSVVLGIALITKSTGALVAIAAFFTLFCAKRITIRRRIVLGILGGILIVLLVGWFHIPRALDTRSPRETLVGNIGNLNSALRVDNSLQSYVTVHPGAVLKHPFNDPWNDEARRQNFWEYWYRSAFFGEFLFDVPMFLAQSMLTLGMALLLFVPVGMLKKCRIADGRVPLCILLLTLTAGAITVRWIYPFSSVSDFRYSVLLVIPVSYFILRGILCMPRTYRIAGYGLYTIFLATCTAFLMLLF